MKPSLDVLIKVADYFNVSVDYLTGRSDIRNTDFMIDVYNTGIIRWMNDRAFKADQKAAIKDNFCEMLVRYKEIVNKYANYMYSDERKTLVNKDVSIVDLSVSSCSAISNQLRDMILWITAFPAEADRAHVRDGDDLSALRERLADMLGVQYNGSTVCFTDDQKDLISIWELLDREGRQILLGTAFTQKQRVMSEKSVSNETA